MREEAQKLEAEIDEKYEISNKKTYNRATTTFQRL